MIGGLACYAQSCNEPVVGQCSGYNGPCGQFYCRMHSSNKLCVECATRKAADAAKAQQKAEQERLQAAQRAEYLRRKAAEEYEVERLYNEYKLAAEKVPDAPDFIGNGCLDILLMIVVGFFGIGILLLGLLDFREMETAQQEQTFQIVVGSYVLLCLVLLIVRSRSRSAKWRAMMAKIEEQKPGFSKFYAAWIQAKSAGARERSQETFKKIIYGTLIVGGAAAKAADEYRRRRAYDDLHDSSEALKEINRKL